MLESRIPGLVADLVLAVLEDSRMIRVLELALLSMTSCLFSSTAPSPSSLLSLLRQISLNSLSSKPMVKEGMWMTENSHL